MVIEAENREKETLGFQAEVTQLLDIMIHSLYSNKEIFLRELISNASDAVDRLRFASLSDPTLLEGAPDFRIDVKYDRAARTISVRDNGIGMSREEVVEHIGTIAKSGTREFFQALTGDQQRDARIIGQFGVGFYSAFVVAEKVILTTRRAGLPEHLGVRWESDGKGQYTLEPVEKATRGTEIVLVLRAGEDDLLTGPRLRAIIRKYSDHISIPIYMDTETKETVEEERINHASALWVRPKQEISKAEYDEFYKHLAHAVDEPLTFVHSHMEGTHEYTLLLYVPTQPPYDLWSRESHPKVKLYVRRVFIMEGNDRLLPRYLRFVQGIIDSHDLPLNVSRELLQHSRHLDAIRATAVKKLLGELSDLAAHQPERYATFWRAFGRVLKEGITEDAPNREVLATLCRFASTSTGKPTQEVALDEYIARMKPGQEKIYYLIAESFTAAQESPLLEMFKKKGIEVLLLSDPVDTLLGTELTEFKGVSLQSIAKGTIDVSLFEDEQEKEERTRSSQEAQNLLERLKDALDEEVKEVRITTRLTTSPACLIVDEYSLDPTLQRLMQSSGQGFPSSKPILEINPLHPLLRKIKEEQDQQRFNDLAALLYEQSILSRGDQLENPIRFVNRLNTLLMQL